MPEGGDIVLAEVLGHLKDHREDAVRRVDLMGLVWIEDHKCAGRQPNMGIPQIQLSRSFQDQFQFKGAVDMEIPVGDAVEEHLEMPEFFIFFHLIFIAHIDPPFCCFAHYTTNPENRKIVGRKSHDCNCPAPGSIL